MAIKHILFDCDGTIVDSEIIAARAMLKVLALHGLDIAESEYNMRYPGLRTRDIITALQEERGFMAPENFYELLREEHLDGFHRSLRAIPGMPGLFRNLRVPKSMVSNGSVMHVEKCLRKVRLRGALDGEIFSAEHVERPKPMPDVYLFAIHKLKLKPEEALVVEDSVTGVRAAKSAGIPTIGFLGAAHIHDGHGEKLQEAGADFLVPDAKDLGDLLRRYGAI